MIWASVNMCLLKINFGYSFVIITLRIASSGKCSFSITFFCVSEFYKMQKLETKFFFSSTSKNNNYVFSIYTRYQGLLLHRFSHLVSN